MSHCDSFARSQQGRSHHTNDDAVLVDPKVGLFVVADGVSGRPGSNRASAVAVETLAEALRPALARGQVDAATLVEAVRAADRQVRATTADASNAKIATTLSALAVTGRRGHVVHVGDSRIYLWRGGELRLLTEDQTVAAELARGGHIEPEMVERHPLRKMLTQSLGDGNTLEPQTLELALEDGDVFVLASDGLGEALPDEELAELLAGIARRPAELIGAALFDRAAERGPADDLTVAVVRVRA